jgi:hypothetical protein
MIGSRTVAYGHNLFDSVNEIFTVAWIASVFGCFDDLKNIIKHHIINNTLDFNQVCHSKVARPTGLSSSSSHPAAKTLDMRNHDARQSRVFMWQVEHTLETMGFDDCLDFFHDTHPFKKL